MTVAHTRLNTGVSQPQRDNRAPSTVREAYPTVPMELSVDCQGLINQTRQRRE